VKAGIKASGRSAGISVLRRAKVTESRACEPVAVERTRLRQYPDVVKIFHPRIGAARRIIA
jgi:hypothetical protein